MQGENQIVALLPGSEGSSPKGVLDQTIVPAEVRDAGGAWRGIIRLSIRLRTYLERAVKIRILARHNMGRG